MWILRLLTVLTAIAVAVGVALYLLTGRRAYLQFSGRVFRFAVFVALLAFFLLALERIAVLPL